MECVQQLDELVEAICDAHQKDIHHSTQEALGHDYFRNDDDFDEMISPALFPARDISEQVSSFDEVEAILATLACLLAPSHTN